ncbi:cytochrome P450 [Streptomyces mirabilis]|uniref:cytochrome P450 n=1 Tax=Streptomyces mirabilis TaxID=68239 RepID=UPI0033AFEF8C
MTQTPSRSYPPGTEYPFGPIPAHEAAEHYHRIAADRPMSRMTMPYGGDVWIIHRNAVARTMLSDARFVREPFRTGERVVPYFVEFPDFLRSTIQFEDPPQHTRLRRLVQTAISPKRVKAMRDSAREFANQLIDRMVAEGDSANLVTEYNVPLPVQMLANLLGVPPEDRAKFESWSHALLAVANMDDQQRAQNMGELYVYLMDMVAKRRGDPRDDLISSLANARDKDDSLTDEEILPIAMILMVGGFDNTANFIGTGVMALLNSPAQLELFRSDPDGLAPTAVEEVLRHGGFATGAPVGGGGGLVPFVATEDVELDGQLVAKGDALLVDPAAASHDGIALPDDDRFDITRKDNPHLTLSYGLHHCLGAPLARMEVQVALSELFKRLPALRLTGDVVVDYDNLTRPITQMPVAW